MTQLCFIVLFASTSKTYIGLVLFRASAFTGANLASGVPAFRALVEYSFVLLD